MPKASNENPRTVVRRLIAIYILVAIVAAAGVLVAAWWTGPYQEAERMGLNQSKMLRLVRDRIDDLRRELEARARLLADSPAIIDFERGDPKRQKALEESINIRTLEEAYIHLYNAKLTDPVRAPPFGYATFFSPEEHESILKWCQESGGTRASRCDFVELSSQGDSESRTVLRACAPVFRTASDEKREFRGVVCVAVSCYNLLGSYLTYIQPLPTSYSFAVSAIGHMPGAQTTEPQLLWHSSGNQMIRMQKRDTKAFLESLRAGFPDFANEPVQEHETISMRHADGTRLDEIVSVETVVFGASRWVIGIGTPRRDAIEHASWRLMITLGAVCVTILLVGIGLLSYQQSRMESDAKEQQSLQVKEVESNYRLFFAENPTSILVFNEREEMIECNQAAERLIGLSKVEATGQHWSSMIHEETGTSLWELLRTAGSIHMLDSNWTRLRDHANLLVEVWGRKIGDNWVLMAHDVEQRRELERQITRFKRMSSMGALASTLAHDFNNLLGQIQIMVSNVKADVAKNTELSSDLTAIEGKVDDASRLVANLLAERETVVSADPVFLEPVLRDFVAGQQKVLPETIELRPDIRPDMPAVWITPHALRRVLDNLVINARDAMQYGGSLTIRGYGRKIDEKQATDQLPADHYAVIEVIDSGKGMTPEVLDTIFEPFFTTKGEGKGSGLGLWTVYRIVRRTGGWVHVRSRIGKGTQFVLYLRHTRPTDRKHAI